MSAAVLEILIIGGVAGIAYGVYKKLEGRYYGRKAQPKPDETKPKENE